MIVIVVIEVAKLMEACIVIVVCVPASCIVVSTPLKERLSMVSLIGRSIWLGFNSSITAIAAIIG